MAIVSALSGAFLAEGFSRLRKSEDIPKEVKDISKTHTDPLKTASIAQLT